MYVLITFTSFEVPKAKYKHYEEVYTDETVAGRPHKVIVFAVIGTYKGAYHSNF